MRHLIDIVEGAQEGSPADLLTDEFYDTMAASPVGQYGHTSLMEVNDRTVDIVTITTTQKRQGYGRTVMSLLCSLADKYNVLLTLSPAEDADGMDGGMEYSDLCDWYESYGFEFVRQSKMARRPDGLMENLGDIRRDAQTRRVELSLIEAGKTIWVKWLANRGARGAARAVMERLCEFADQHGMRLALEVLDGDEDLIRYYEEFGFRVDELTRDDAEPRMTRAPQALRDGVLCEGRVHEIDTGYRGIVRMTRVFENPTVQQAASLTKAAASNQLFYLRGVLYGGRIIWVANGNDVTHADIIHHFIPDKREGDSDIATFEVLNYAMYSLKPTRTDPRIRVALEGDHDVHSNPHVIALLRGCERADEYLWESVLAERAEADLSWFAGSRVVDRKGQPLVCYHGGNDPIDAFRPWTHFGTSTAANQRLLDRGNREGAMVYPVYLRITNPLTVSDAQASDEATLLHAISRGQYPDIDGAVARRQGVIAACEAAGYDGLVYHNTFEDRGRRSWVIFRSDQVRPAV